MAAKLSLDTISPSSSGAGTITVDPTRKTLCCLQTVERLLSLVQVLL